MTFDDGILEIYSIKNGADKGDKPKKELVYKSSCYFGYDDVGITRFYTAKSNNQLIEMVVHLQYDRTIRTNDIVKMEDGTFFNIAMCQHPKDEDGLFFTKLSLERLENEPYI